MQTSEYLSLASARVKAREKWATPSAGLTFSFVKAGAGLCAGRKGSQRVEMGDVLVVSPDSRR